MATVVDVAVFRPSSSPQSTRIELTESGPARIVTGAPRLALAAFNYGPARVVFYNPDGKDLEPLEVGVGVLAMNGGEMGAKSALERMRA